MEEWIKHMHLGGGKCFQMYFSEYDRVRRFRVIALDSSGFRRAVDLDTREEFEFYSTMLLKIDYSTLIEIDCAI
jgi:hypothetical protein